MQTIQVTLNDSLLEQAVLRLAKEQHQNLREFVMTALNYYVREAEKTTPLKVQKLNPFQHAQPPSEAFHAITADELVFTEIQDSVAFAKKLRQQTWQFHE
jgi:hypothetical protein